MKRRVLVVVLLVVVGIAYWGHVGHTRADAERQRAAHLLRQVQVLKQRTECPGGAPVCVVRVIRVRELSGL